MGHIPQTYRNGNRIPGGGSHKSRVAGNIQKAWRIWGRLAKVLGREGVEPKVSRTFYIAVTQQVLLFGAEAWVLMAKMEKALDAFQGRVARKLTRR